MTHTLRNQILDRFVDDVFVIMKRDKIEDFYKQIESLHVKLKFTTEVENDGRPAFLDTEIKRNPNKSLSVAVYRKPTHTDQYLNANFHHLDSVNNSVIPSLFYRAKSITSNLDNLDNYLKRISNVVEANEYKLDDICKVTRKISKPRQNIEADKEKSIFVEIKYKI